MLGRLLQEQTVSFTTVLYRVFVITSHQTQVDIYNLRMFKLSVRISVLCLFVCLYLCGWVYVVFVYVCCVCTCEHLQF